MGVLLRPPSSHDQPVEFPPLPRRDRRRVSFWNHLSRSITTHWHTVECWAEVHTYPAKTCQGRYRSDATEQLQVSAGCWSGPRRTRVTLQALMSSTPNIVLTADSEKAEVLPYTGYHENIRDIPERRRSEFWRTGGFSRSWIRYRKKSRRDERCYTIPPLKVICLPYNRNEFR